MSKQDRQGARTPAGLDKWRGQDEVFNHLTKNGQSKGIFRDENGNLYINADYIKTGKLAADMIDVVNLIAQQLNAVDDAGNYVQIEKGVIRAGNAYKPHFSLHPTSDPGIYKLSFDNVATDGRQVSGSMMWNNISLGSVENEYPAFSVTAETSGHDSGEFAKIRLPVTEGVIGTKELYAYWESNGDGTYSIVGHEELQ